MKTRGQALLPLLIVIIIALSLGTAAIELAISGVIIDRYSQEELMGFYVVEAALENALLRTLRNPNYVGENLQINDTSCTIEITGAAPKIIQARCDNGRQIRKMQAEASFVNGEMVVENIEEIE
jgi:hypothetical protein